MAFALHASQGNKGAIFTGFGARTAASTMLSPERVIWHRALPDGLTRCAPRSRRHRPWARSSPHLGTDPIIYI